MQKEINNAVLALKKGGVILIPTETVYGIAADATNKNAIQKIYQIKQRDASKPLQLLVKNLKEAEKFVSFNEISRKAALKYWSGPLTLILNEKGNNNLSKNLNNSDGTIGVRVPNHQILAELFEHIDFPLAATSANLSGNRPFLEFKQAEEYFTGRVDYLLDGGNAEIGEASTIADLRNNINIIREGKITAKDIGAL
ncbi:MAG TPA: threonylcarbamoyl-AMP synthase [Alphaproteobacteria bacterium]|nr:threonylcarbamoyl-AMP synthase [Alphaproteobacteria bacterium]